MKQVKVIRKTSVIIVLCFIILFGSACSQHKTEATTIFYDTVGNVVEVKAEYQAMISYGTAVFVSVSKDKGTSLITNAHVVFMDRGISSDQIEIYIRFADEENYRPVKVTRYNAEIDLAILELTEADDVYGGSGLKTDYDVDYGDKVYAIGNAMNSGLSLTEGIVSNPLIDVNDGISVRKVIQTDITIASGNSGGALLNSDGRLVGITTFRLYDENGQTVYGYTYAIPAETVVNFILESE